MSKKYGVQVYGMDVPFWAISEMRRDPDLKYALTMLASAENKMAKYREAIESSKEAIEADPLFQEAWLNLGISYKALDQVENAKNALQTAYQLDPTEEVKGLLDNLM